MRRYLTRHKIAAQAVSCPAKIVGGWYRSPTDFGHYGVWLDLPLRDYWCIKRRTLKGKAIVDRTLDLQLDLADA